ncbi:MAG: hypothetical protein U1E09_00335 [Methylococcales bacterium]|nr:hypothetical protein [Methylobacter sp.]MDZ4154971.1 hypothetical protein [Methylococcales bacterium]MDP2097491.1 hypothetical protein [Methylobacter sp.]MDP2426682.1 hypothetical protein [Methylobacter sp.]MDP3055349.1 hypothetical protein [Methylobacter sp.]
MKLVWFSLLAGLLSACATNDRNHELLMSLAVNECAESRQNSSKFNQGKSYQLIKGECEQLQVLDENYQRITNKRFSKNSRLTYPEDQEYFDEETWFLVTERIRETYYPQYLPPNEEVERAHFFNEKQRFLDDESVRRAYEPRLLPVSPYLMNKKELEKAHEAISDLIYENRDDKKLHRLLSVLSVIVAKESIRKGFGNY